MKSKLWQAVDNVLYLSIVTCLVMTENPSALEICPLKSVYKGQTKRKWSSFSTTSGQNTQFLFVGQSLYLYMLLFIRRIPSLSCARATLKQNISMSDRYLSALNKFLKQRYVTYFSLSVMIHIDFIAYVTSFLSPRLFSSFQNTGAFFRLVARNAALFLLNSCFFTLVMRLYLLFESAYSFLWSGSRVLLKFFLVFLYFPFLLSCIHHRIMQHL